MDDFKGQIAFGGASFSSEGGGYGMGTVINAQELIETAIDRGVTLFDTAPIYGFNQSEKTLGQFLKPFREKVQLVSKGGVSWHSSRRVNMTNEPKVIQKMLEESLRNLNSDFIDIYMIHWPDAKVDIRFALDVLEKAKQEEKIKSIGLCNTTVSDLQKSKEVCLVEYIQSECNLFNNEVEVLKDIIKEMNLKTMGWGTFDKGILAGTVKKDRVFESVDCRSWAPWWKKSNWKEKVDKVERMNQALDVHSLELALHYALSEVDYVLCGMKNLAQLEQVLEIRTHNISQEDLKKALHIARN